MPKPRIPISKAKVTGALKKNPKRFVERSDPQSSPLGDPSQHMDQDEIEVWEAFKKEIPWLLEADRTLMEIACKLRARIWTDPDIGIAATNQLRMCLGQMGGTPADRSKVSVPDVKKEDPSAKYFN